jgi:hypothetical protein
MTDLFSLSGTLVDTIGTNIVKTLTFLAAVGSLSMALVQVFKDLAPIRQRFNHTFLWNWYIERLFIKPPHTRRNYGLRLENSGSNRVELAFNETVMLATGGHWHALMDLSVEQLCGQLNSAAQIALEYPLRYRNFYDVLVAGADPGDIEIVAGGNPDSTDAKDASSGPKSNGAEQDAGEDKQRYLEARARVGQFSQRSIDALHIRLGARWKWWLQIASFLFSAAITYAAFAIDRNDWSLTSMRPNGVFYLVLSCIVGGFLAPVARDIVAAVRGRS